MSGRVALSPVRVQASHVDSGGGEDAGKVCVGQAKVAAPADAYCRDGLVDGALDASPDPIMLLPLFGGLLGTCPFDCLADLARAQNHLPAAVGRACSLWMDGAGLTGSNGESHHNGLSAAFGAGRPDRVGDPLREGDPLVVPVDRKRGAVETVFGPSLDRVVDAQRSQQCDPEGTCALGEQFRGVVAGTHNVLAGKQVRRPRPVWTSSSI